MEKAVCKQCNKEFEYELTYAGRGEKGKPMYRQFCSRTCSYRFHGTTEKRREYLAKYRRENPTKQLLARIKYKCKKGSIDFNLTVDELPDIPSVCPVLGIPLVNYCGTGRTKGYEPDSISLDRINPNGGYVKGNVRFISSRANLLKSDATVEELTKVLEDLKNCEKNNM